MSSIDSMVAAIQKLFSKLELIDDHQLDIDSKLIMAECRNISHSLLASLNQNPRTQSELENLITKAKRPNPKVLVIDHDEVQQKLIKFGLESKGFEVHSVFDSTHCMGAVTQHSPDIIVVEAIMPKKSGLELLFELKSHPEYHRFKVILVSSRSFENMRLATLEGGADDFIAKPYSLAEIAAKLRYLVA